MKPLKLYLTHDFKKSVYVRKIQKYLSKSSSKLELNLKYIDDHFKILKNTIKILETRNLTIDESVNLIENIHHDLSNLNSKSGKIALERINEVLSANPGYKEIKTIVDIIKGKITNAEFIKLNTYKIKLFKFFNKL